jgi:galactoside O-acetyltransferase
MCTIGRNVTIGMGANVIDGITIGENSTIGAGSVVTRNIPAHVVAYGVPAVVVREKEIKK